MRWARKVGCLRSGRAPEPLQNPRTTPAETREVKTCEFSLGGLEMDAKSQMLAFRHSVRDSAASTEHGERQ